MTPLASWCLSIAATSALLLLARAAAGAGRTRRVMLLALLLGCAALVGVWTWRVSEPRHLLYADFYKAYYPAGEAARAGDVEALRVLLDERDFVNLPIVAYLFVPLAALGIPASGHALAALGIAAVLAAWVVIVRVARLDAARALLLLALVAIHGPLHYSFREGNTTHLVLAALLAAFVAASRRRDLLAGVLLGAAAVVKLPLLLFGIYYAAAGRWRVVAGGAAVVLLAGALSLGVFGWEMNRLWYRDCVKPFTDRPIPAYNVQSVDAFLVRFHTGPHLLRDWDPYKPPRWARVARVPLLLAIYGAAAWALFDLRRDRGAPLGVAGAWRDPAAAPADPAAARREALNFAIVLALATLTSPLSWSHYYLFLLLPLGLTMGARGGAGVAWAAAAVLLSPPALVLRAEAAWLDEVVARSLVSHCFVGGMLLFGVLLTARRALAAAGPVERTLRGENA